LTFVGDVGANAIGGVVTAIAIGVVVFIRDGRAQGAANVREVDAMNQDARRWLADQDRVTRIQESATTNDMAARGSFHSGAHLRGLAAVRIDALHQYRDEMTRKLRRYREIDAQDGWRHRLARRDDLPALRLTEPSLAVLARWRSDVTVNGIEETLAVDDPTSEEREPDLRRFERLGEPPQGESLSRTPSRWRRWPLPEGE
jgi:hypothetical protein